MVRAGLKRLRVKQRLVRGCHRSRCTVWQLQRTSAKHAGPMLRCPQGGHVMRRAAITVMDCTARSAAGLCADALACADRNTCVPWPRRCQDEGCCESVLRAQPAVVGSEVVRMPLLRQPLSPRTVAAPSGYLGRCRC